MERIDGFPLYHISIDEFNEDDGVTIMSIVDAPAVEKEFLKFSKTQKYSIDTDKRIITGVALRADYPIYRTDENGRGYYVSFSKECIERIVMKFMREQKTARVNTDHNKDVNGIFLFESFILNEHHKLSYPGFEDVADGSWMVSYKVDNPQVWDRVKRGSLNGFSVELNAGLKSSDQLNYRDIYRVINILSE